MKKFLTYFEIFYLIYFLVGVVCGIITYFSIDVEIPQILIDLYISTFFYPVATIIYIIFGCLLYKHRNFLMNIIDGLLCFALTFFLPGLLNAYIYEFNKYLYYFMGLCFSFLPIIFCFIEKKKIEFFHIIKIITRILMIILSILILLMLESCGA